MTDNNGRTHLRARADATRGWAGTASEPERLLHLLTDNAPVLIAYCDTESRFRFVNKPYAERFGLTPDDCIGRPIPEIVGEQAYAAFRPYVEWVLAGQPVQFETRVPYAAIGDRIMLCSYVPEFDGEGAVTGWVATIVDVTDRKKAEEALRASERNFAKMFRSLPVAVALSRITDGAIVDVNDAFTLETGFTREEVIGRTSVEIGLRRDVESRDRILEQLQCSGSATNLEVQVFTKAGEPRDIIMNVRAIDLQGTKYLLWSAADITDRKRAEQAVLEADRRKTEFLATLAHELRNPLAPIRFAVKILQSQVGSLPPAERPLGVIDRQISHMARLVDDLLDVSRITQNRIQLRPERVALAEVMNAALEATSPLLEAAGHKLSLDLPDRDVTLHADAARLVQVFSNLLNNASKFTPPGGRISFAARIEERNVIVRVSDTGVGIAPDALPNVFNMFHQSDNMERGGTGLGIGLTLAKRLVELHGGTIEARSEGLGRGTDVIVTLPAVVPDERPAHARADEGPDRASSAGLRVLIVDDNTDAAEMLQVFADAEGHTTAVAYEGRSALALIKSFGPDVVLLDIGLPGLSGYDVARTVRQRDDGREVYLVAVTGWGQDEDRHRAREAGFDFHLTKPVDPSTLEGLLDGIAHTIRCGGCERCVQRAQTRSTDPVRRH